MVGVWLRGYFQECIAVITYFYARPGPMEHFETGLAGNMLEAVHIAVVRHPKH